MTSLKSFCASGFAGALTVALLALAAMPDVCGAASFEKPFSYFADRQAIAKVLESFANAQGYDAQTDPSLSGTVSGRFTAIKPGDFLAAMGEAYGAAYYTTGRTIHFYDRRSVQQEFIPVPRASSQALLASLKHSGCIASELPVSITGEGGLLSVLGPAAYIDQIRTAAAAYQSVMSEKVEVRVFPLKYAWADDITLENMDQTVTVPRIASILRGIVLGQSVGGETVSRDASVVPSVPSLGGEGLSKQSVWREKRSPAQQAAGADGPVAAGSISIIADPRVNAVLISDAASRMPYYEKVIADLDKPVELVEIHAAIVDIDTNASRELGVNLSGRGGSGSWSGGGSLGSANNTSYDSAGNPIITTSSGAAGALLSTIYTHGSDYFMARISALESENAARMLGRPSVLTVDNVQAVLENTTSYYIPLRGNEAVDLYKVESGTVLRVTPHIIRTPEGTSIKLAVSVQDDQSDADSGYQNVGGESSDAVTVSPIKQTKINTQAVVGVGESLLIGGYYYEQKSEGTSGVPLLKDIPLLVALFRSTTNSGRQMERLILITPRIVTTNMNNVPERVRTANFRRSALGATYELELTPVGDDGGEALRIEE